MPRESMARNFVYQAPFFAMQAIGAWIVLSSGSRKFIDLALATFIALGSLHYLSKPFGAAMLGGPGERPQDYLSTAYAMFSQSVGAVFVMATALVLLAMLVGDLLRDVTRRSITDPLTGLLNRRGFEEQLAAMVARHGRGRPPLSLVLSDLDGFKAINDAHGHAAGDRVIESFASTLREATAGLHVVGRIGGEEYAVVLSNCNVATARLFAESVRAAFAATRVDGFDGMTRFTASFGVATLGPEEVPASLLERADSALYVAKRAGRNCVRVARPFVAEEETGMRSAG
jgi:diguanylate cyclase (GGDEF)-like protein